MEALFIEPTEHSAKVNFNPSGKLLLEGRSMPENVSAFYDPLTDFVVNLNVDNVIFDINLEYFNTATSKKLLVLLRKLDANNKINSVFVNWHYEEGDDDSLEMAEIYEEECIMRSKFRYVIHAESISLTDRVNFLA